jgi:hypothetical protein
MNYIRHFADFRNVVINIGINVHPKFRLSLIHLLEMDGFKTKQIFKNLQESVEKNYDCLKSDKNCVHTRNKKRVFFKKYTA